MNELNTYTVYTMTPRGNFSQKYEGTDEQEARKAYNRLEAKQAPRCLSRKVGHLSTTIEHGGGFPQ